MRYGKQHGSDFLTSSFVGTPYDSGWRVSVLSRHLFSTSFSVTQAWLEEALCVWPQKGPSGQDIPQPLEAGMEMRGVRPPAEGRPLAPLSPSADWPGLVLALDQA